MQHFFKSHFGHDFSEKNLRISKSDAQKLTVKLSDKVSTSRISKDTDGYTGQQIFTFGYYNEEGSQKYIKKSSFNQSRRFTM